MNNTNTLESKVAVVIGMINPATAGVVAGLLKQGCTVMAPSKNLQQLDWLKQIAASIPTGKLLTQLTDMPDYEKAHDIAEAIIEKYGHIVFSGVVKITIRRLRLEKRRESIT